MSKILHCPWIVANINMASKNTNLFGFRILYAQFGKERLPFSSMARNQPKDKRFTRSEQSLSTPFINKHWTISDRSVVKIQKEVKLPLTDLQEKAKSSAVILGELCGLDVEDVGHMVCKRPRILLLDDQQIKRRIKTLRSVGLKELNIATMLKKSPGILTSRIENCLEEKARHDIQWYSVIFRGMGEGQYMCLQNVRNMLYQNLKTFWPSRYPKLFTLESPHSLGWIGTL